MLVRALVMKASLDKRVANALTASSRACEFCESAGVLQRSETSTYRIVGSSAQVLQERVASVQIRVLPNPNTQLLKAVCPDVGIGISHSVNEEADVQLQASLRLVIGTAGLTYRSSPS